MIVNKNKRKFLIFHPTCWTINFQITGFLICTFVVRNWHHNDTCNKREPYDNRPFLFFFPNKEQNNYRHHNLQVKVSINQTCSNERVGRMEINIEWKLSQINLHWRYIPIQITGISVLSWSRPTDRQRAYFRRPPRKTPRQRTKLARVLSKDENFCFFRRNFGEISCFGGRRNERGGRNVDGRNIRKFRQKAEKFQINFGKRRNFGDFFKKIASVGKFQRKIVLFRFISAIFRPKKQKFSYQSSPRTGYKI